MTKSKRVPLIECTYDVRLANGTTDRVNRVTMNLALACLSVGTDKYIQMESGAWIRPSKLIVLGSTPGQIPV